MCVQITSTAPTASSLAAYADCGTSFGVRYGDISPAPTNPKRDPADLRAAAV